MNWRRTGCLAAVVACFLWAMGMISACAVGSQGPKGKELLEAEYDRIIWHNGGLIEAVKQENRWWYLLTGDDMTELSVPNGVRPWKREDESIWASDSEGRTGLMDFNGCMLLPCRYERIETYLGGKILESYERTETGMERCLWDREGNPIYRISIQDGNDIKVVSENAFLVQQNFEYFLIDGQGRRILPGTYEKHGKKVVMLLWEICPMWENRDIRRFTGQMEPLRQKETLNLWNLPDRRIILFWRAEVKMRAFT